jgi:hypothetical protein
MKEEDEKDSTINVPNWNDLPPEMWLHCFTFLSIEDIMHCCCVNKTWLQICNSETLWLVL